MKRKDLQYLNSWSKCFRKASVATVMKGLIEGIWVNSNKDPEDIYLVYPQLIIRSVGVNANIDKQFGTCPFEFSFEDGETYRWKKEGDIHQYKGRMIMHYGETWWLDKYEARKAVTKYGLKLAKKYKITKEEVEALHDKYDWDDESAYKELMANKPYLTVKSEHSDYTYDVIDEYDYKHIRAAFIPHCDRLYNWMDNPEKAGINCPECK